jgi:hypothetical protein
LSSSVADAAAFFRLDVTKPIEPLMRRMKGRPRPSPIPRPSFWVVLEVLVSLEAADVAEAAAEVRVEELMVRVVDVLDNVGS